MNKDKMIVVDSDVHVNDSPTNLAPYIEMPWRVSLETLGSIEGSWRYLSIPGYSPEFGGTVQAWPGGHDGARSVKSAQQMRQDLDGFHIDIGILFPDNLLKIAVLPQKDYAAALARAYNAWLVDQWCDVDMTLKGLLIAAPQDPIDAAREIEKYSANKGIVGVYLPCAGLTTLWGDEIYDPIFRAAESANLPVLLHAVTVIHPSFSFNNYQSTTVFGQHCIIHPLSMMVNMVRMLETGVPVRFPKLKIGFMEAGVSWVPFMMMRLDKEYLERRRYVSILERPPSHYIKEFYYATQPIEEPENPKDLLKILELYNGENNTMFASDWPHHDFDHPNKVAHLPLSDEARRKIMGENALRFFNIDESGNRLF